MLFNSHLTESKNKKLEKLGFCAPHTEYKNFETNAPGNTYTENANQWPAPFVFYNLTNKGHTYVGVISYFPESDFK